MLEFIKRKNYRLMFFSCYLSIFFCAPLIHWMTIPPMSWYLSFKLAFVICGGSSPVLAFMGLLTDWQNLDYMKRAMLKKLEQD
jgi:hypothetical protein